MKRLLSLIGITILALGCTQNIDNDNSNLINAINSIEDVQTIIEFRVDSLGNFLDTLSIQKNKTNKQGEIVYKENIFHKDVGYLISKNYYRNNGELFYSKLESSEYGIMSTFESWEKNDEIYKAFSVEYNNNKQDTIYLDYEYFYKPDRKKDRVLVIAKYSDGFGNKTEQLYNDDGKLKSEILLSGNDTLSITKYDYRRGVNSKRTIINYQDQSTVYITYDLSGFLDQEEVFIKERDSLIKISQTDYETDAAGKITRSVETKYPSNNKRYTVFKYQ